MMPSSAEIHYFSEAANSLNFSRAAERLGVTQPALTHSIKKLENALGTQLFIRSKTGVQLTKFGQKFLIQSRLLIEQWDRLKNEALRDETEIQGRFSIGAHTSVALFSLQHFLPTLLEKHPLLEVTLTHDLSRNITESIIRYQIDFGIVVNPVAHPDLVITELSRDEVTFWKSPKLKNADTLICDPELLQTGALLKKMKSAGLDFKRTLTSSSLEVVKNLAEAGTGVGIIPGKVVSRSGSTRLIRIPKAPVFHDRICLTYRMDAQKSSAAKAVLQAIKSISL